MLNALWIVLLAGGLLYGAVTGQVQTTTQAAMIGASDAVTLVIQLMGVTMFYMGLMEIAKQSGLAKRLARGLSWMIAPLFKTLDKEGPAMQAICMNLAANMLGMGNAATPLGLQAMQEMQKLNPNKKRASNEMITLIVLNAGSVQLIPTTVIALRAATGSQDPAGITLLVLAVTLTTAFLAALLCYLLHR